MFEHLRRENRTAELEAALRAYVAAESGWDAERAARELHEHEAREYLKQQAHDLFARREQPARRTL